MQNIRKALAEIRALVADLPEEVIVLGFEQKRWDAIHNTATRITIDLGNGNKLELFTDMQDKPVSA